MKRKYKIISGIFGVFIALFLIFYLGKENPRVFLNDKINTAYVNENIKDKNFENVIHILKKSGFKINDKTEKSLKYIKSVYILSDSSLVSDKKSYVGIVDTGYMYPIFALKLGKYFDKGSEYYVIKPEYADKYTKGQKIYLKIERGNFIIAEYEKDIEKILKSEKYFNQTLISILEREQKNNLGIMILNLDKKSLDGFNEFTLTGNVDDEDRTSLTASIIGKNNIIKNFNNILNDGLSGDRVIEKNKLYLRTAKEKEFKFFMFFLNYLFKNTAFKNISSKIYINVPKDKDMEHIPKDKLIKVNIEEKQFITGYIDIVIKGKKIGETELKGFVEDNKVSVNTVLDESTVVNLFESIRGSEEL